jgi:hypothetical protein
LIGIGPGFRLRDRVSDESVAPTPDGLDEAGVVGVVAECSADGRHAGGYGGITDGFGLPYLADQFCFRDGPSGMLDQVKKEVEGLGTDRYGFSCARKPVETDIELEVIKSVERQSIASRSLQMDSSADTRNSLCG